MPLMALRGLPRLLTRRPGFRPDSSAPLLDEFLKVGFVLLGERAGAEIAVGAVGRFWRPAGNEPMPMRGRDDFVAFAEPGYAKMALDLRAVPDGDGARLETETRIYLTDASARRRFGAYWLLIRPFSGLVRRSWLRAARRRAEAG